MYGGMGGLSTYFMEFVGSDQDRLFENAVLYFGIEPPHEEYMNFCGEQRIQYFTVMKRQGLDLLSYLKVLGGGSTRQDYDHPQISRRTTVHTAKRARQSWRGYRNAKPVCAAPGPRHAPARFCLPRRERTLKLSSA